MEETTPASGQTSANSVPVAETVKNPEAVLANNRELIVEKKALAGKLADLETQLSKISDDKKIAEGNKDEVITSLRAKLAETEQKAKDDKDAFNWNTVEGHIKQVAASNGCTDTIALMDLIKKDDLNTIQVFDDYSVEEADVKNVLETVSKRHPKINLFGKQVKIDDAIPSNKISSSKKPLGKMTTEELEAEMLKL